MTTVEEARTEIIALFRTAWEANATSLAVPLVYENVTGSGIPEGEDANGRVLPWARLSVRQLVENQETLGAPGNRRFLNEGIATAEIYTAIGDGHTLGGELARIGKLAWRGTSTASGIWFTQVTSREIGADRGWFRIDVVANFNSEDRG